MLARCRTEGVLRHAFVCVPASDLSSCPFPNGCPKCHKDCLPVNITSLYRTYPLTGVLKYHKRAKLTRGLQTQLSRPTIRRTVTETASGVEPATSRPHRPSRSKPAFQISAFCCAVESQGSELGSAPEGAAAHAFVQSMFQNWNERLGYKHFGH
jgi:hypothetical protein